jgi:hypothetical protein
MSGTLALKPHGFTGLTDEEMLEIGGGGLLSGIIIGLVVGIIVEGVTKAITGQSASDWVATGLNSAGNALSNLPTGGRTPAPPAPGPAR